MTEQPAGIGKRLNVVSTVRQRWEFLLGVNRVLAEGLSEEFHLFGQELSDLRQEGRKLTHNGEVLRHTLVPLFCSKEQCLDDLRTQLGKFG